MSEFGSKLKQGAPYYGQFKNKEEVEGFIITVSEESPTVLEDFLPECGKREFNKYGEFVKNNPSISIDELAEKIGNDNPNGSSFSHWIRARFIKEIIKQNL